MELKKVRKELGLTQAEMANLLGYSSRISISAIETGTRTMNSQTAILLKIIKKHGIESSLFARA